MFTVSTDLLYNVWSKDLQYLVYLSYFFEDPPFCKKKKKGMLDGGASSVRVVIDLGYEHLMNDKVYTAQRTHVIVVCVLS